MMPNRPLRRCAAFVLALALIPQPAALAQSAATRANAPPLSQSLQGPAKEAYESAKLLVANRDSAGALSKFKQAYDISKDPRLLYDMAVCEKNLNHYARMQSLLEEYLRDSGPRLSADEHELVDNALAAIKNLVAKVRLTASEDGAVVVVDGEVVGTTPLVWPVVVDLGKHTLLVKKSGFEPASQAIDVSGGSESTLAVTLRPPSHVARVAVTSDDEATVIVDGAVVGQGRFEGRLAPGGHEVRVTESGKKPYETTVNLHDGELRTMQVTLESESHGSIWPWLIGAAVVAGGAVVGGYFLLQPPEETAPQAGSIGSLQFQERRR